MDTELTIKNILEALINMYVSLKLTIGLLEFKFISNVRRKKFPHKYNCPDHLNT